MSTLTDTAPVPATRTTAGEPRRQRRSPAGMLRTLIAWLRRHPLRPAGRAPGQRLAIHRHPRLHEPADRDLDGAPILAGVPVEMLRTPVVKSTAPFAPGRRRADRQLAPLEAIARKKPAVRPVRADVSICL
jgi:hypothetical protein